MPTVDLPALTVQAQSGSPPPTIVGGSSALATKDDSTYVSFDATKRGILATFDVATVPTAQITEVRYVARGYWVGGGSIPASEYSTSYTQPTPESWPMLMLSTEGPDENANPFSYYNISNFTSSLGNVRAKFTLPKSSATAGNTVLGFVDPNYPWPTEAHELRITYLAIRVSYKLPLEQIKMTEIPHHVLGRFTSPDYIYGTQVGQDRVLIREAGFTCQIGPKGVSDRRHKNDQNWQNPVIRLSDGRLVVIDGAGNYDYGPEIWAAVLDPDDDIPSDKVAAGAYAPSYFQWGNKIYGRGVDNGGFTQVFNRYWLPSYWQGLPPTVSYTCYLWFERAWQDLNDPNTVYWVGKVEGLDHQYYPSWYSYGANYLFRFFIDPTDNSVTADSSFVVQLGNFWEGSSGGSSGAWDPAEAGPLTNSLFWVHQRGSEDIGGPSYDNHETFRVFDYSGNEVFQSDDLFPYTYEYNGDPDYMAGSAIVRRGTDGTLVVALQRYHSHESPPEYTYSGYMNETWLEMERWEWNGSALVKTQSKSLAYTYALDESYYWDLQEWKPEWWVVTTDECLSPPIPYGDPAYGLEDIGRALSVNIMDNDFNITHKYTAPTILSSDDINDNEDERLNFTAWTWTVISPIITPQGNGIFGWEWQDEWGPNALYDPISQLYHFSLFDEGEQTIDPVWGKHGETAPWSDPKPAYPTYDPSPVKSKGADPWNDESADTYTYSGYWDNNWYNMIHYAELQVPEDRDSLLDVVGLKLSITVQNTAPTLVHWQWYMYQIGSSNDGSSVSFGDATVPLGPSEIQTYTEIYSDHIMRNVDYDGLYWPKVMVPDPTDFNNNGWTLPDAPYMGHSGWWGGEWGGYAPATFAKLKWILMNQGFGLEISPDLGYDDEDPDFDLSTYQFRVLNVKMELVTGNQPKRATYINKASTGTAPNWVNVCPVEGVATEYPVTIQQTGAYAEIAGEGSIWYDGSDDTYAIVGTINNSLSRLEVQIPPTPAFTSTSAVTLHLRAEANHTTASGVQMIFAMYSQPWDGNGTGFLGSFRTGTSSSAFIPEGGIQDMTLTMANFYDSAIYSALQAGGVYLYAYGSTQGTTNYWVKIYEAQVYVNGEAVAPEIVGASGADNRLNIGDDTTQDWRPMHFDWTGGGFNKWQPVRFNVSTDGGQDWYVACPHAYGWE